MQSLAESSHINAELYKETTYMIKKKLKFTLSNFDKQFVVKAVAARFNFLLKFKSQLTQTPIDQTFPIMGDHATFSNHFSTITIKSKQTPRETSSLDDSIRITKLQPLDFHFTEHDSLLFFYT